MAYKKVFVKPKYELELPLFLKCNIGVYTYIPLMLYPRRGTADIPSSLQPKLLSYEKYCRRDRG
jgi:hypothetical protein